MFVNYYKKMRNGINIDLTKEIACTKNIICTTVLHEYSLAKPRHNLSVYCQRIVPKLRHLEDILRDTNRSIEDMYYEFKIPKASGGMRTITAPDPALKEVQAAVAKHLTKN